MQAFNPYLPSYEYIPDGEPYVFGDRLYVYGSHDAFNGKEFCQNDYVCWSAPIDDLGNWRYEGVIYKKIQDPHNKDGSRRLFAPDVQLGIDGRYYLYYALDSHGIMSVAVCDEPAGKYEYYGTVHYPDGKAVGYDKGDIYQFDPGVFIDDDKRVFLYTGFAPRDGQFPDDSFGYRRIEGAYCIELEQDMVTVKAGPKLILPKAGYAKGTSFEGHEFFEASSMRKINGKYYLVYSSINAHELCYAISDRPDGGFTFGGTIVSNGDVFYKGRELKDCVNYLGNNHGGLVQIKDQWYVFYHRQTNRHSYSRQGCAEKIYINEDGHIPQVEITSCGLNNGPLVGQGRYESYIACHLTSKWGAGFYTNNMEDYKDHPYFTQSGQDRESNPDQYIANIQDGGIAGFKYFDLSNTNSIAIEVRGEGEGEVIVTDGIEGEILTKIPVRQNKDYQIFKNSISKGEKKSALYFKYTGRGYIDFKVFYLE